MTSKHPAPRTPSRWSEHRPPRAVVRRSSGNWALQAALERRGLGPVAGVDEAGRGACAGPLVVAGCVLRRGDAKRFSDLTDSKLLTARSREALYARVLERAVAHSIVVVPPEETDALGIHVANLQGMRRAVATLDPAPGYVLVDGFRVSGLGVPNLSVIKGDLTAACVAAASVLAKVSRDRIMTELHTELPAYGFAAHKGYATREHTQALTEYGPSSQHRWSYANVVEAARLHRMRPPRHVSKRPGSLGVRDADVVDNELAGVTGNEEELGHR